MADDTSHQPYGAEGDEDEDYMSMAIVEPTKPKERETYTQRRIRKEREAEQKGRTKSKKELQAEAAAAREAALATSLSSDSKGFRMMEKLGFKQGEALGAKNSNARLNPIGLQVKEDRGGIGLDTEKKRKFREDVEDETKRVKAEEGDYRERVAREREERRLEGLIGGAMRVAERMDTEAGSPDGLPNGDSDCLAGNTPQRVPLREINVLWRGLVRDRDEKERERRMRYDLHQSLSRNANYDDLEEDEQDRLALGKDEAELEEEDPELDAFVQSTPEERLERLVGYLREKYKYCFWCKHQYDSSDIDSCPGTTEDDHD